VVQSITHQEIVPGFEWSRRGEVRLCVGGKFRLASTKSVNRAYRSKLLHRVFCLPGEFLFLGFYNFNMLLADSGDTNVPSHSLTRCLVSDIRKIYVIHKLRQRQGSGIIYVSCYAVIASVMGMQIFETWGSPPSKRSWPRNERTLVFPNFSVKIVGLVAKHFSYPFRT
jgi:hypothetical protein